MDAQRWKHRLDQLSFETQRKIAKESPEYGESITLLLGSKVKRA